MSVFLRILLKSLRQNHSSFGFQFLTTVNYINYFCSAITEIDNLGGPKPHLPDGVTGPGHCEQTAEALRGGQSPKLSQMLPKF